MLKTHSTSLFIVPQRLKLISLAGRMDRNATGAQRQARTMSNEATLPTQPTGQVPRGRGMTFFPLGYKEAATQWVCNVSALSMLTLAVF